jgi:heme-degrading monooxygenase HmoA
MVIVVFEAEPTSEGRAEYLERAAALAPLVAGVDGFLGIERFQSLADPDRILSLSTWRDEQAVAEWRAAEAHVEAQAAGRDHVFASYRIRVAEVVREHEHRA